MRKKVFLFVIGLSTIINCFSQSGESPNSANSSAMPAASSKISDNYVNIFTGQANVSVPIYSFKNNSGLSMSVSLEYTGGSGIALGESPTIVGLGWYLNAGGEVTRQVRGLPDDMPTYGYMEASAIPSDWRSNGSNYYFDNLDAQQDIFQYSFPGHSGKFYIGKNGQIVTVPLAKIKIVPTFATSGPWIATYQKLLSFRIIAEDGVKYDFEEFNYGSVSCPGSGLDGVYHGVAWQLTRMISPFSNDTIKFNYTNLGGGYGGGFPQITYVNNSDGTRKTPSFTNGGSFSSHKQISSIELPDKTTIAFLYSGDSKYISKIQIRDTAFRFGYRLGYDSTYIVQRAGHSIYYDTIPVKLMLTSVTPYTSQEKQEGYKFGYMGSFPKPGSYGDTLSNKMDYWGYYNGII